MKKLRFKKIDAFATDKSAGNPAGAIYLSTPHELAPEEMQRIAAELKGFVNEVGFVSRLRDDTYSLEYYSSEREVEFCGHATIAIMYDLLVSDASLLARPAVHIVTRRGTSVVENRIPDEDAVFISAPLPVFSGHPVSRDHAAEALSIGARDIPEDYPIEVVNAGLETLIMPVRALEKILAASPDFMKLKLFCEENRIDIVELFCPEVSDKANRFRTRVFAPRYGYLEDPATGSGNAALGYYLLKHGKWDGRVLSLEQNDRRERPNIVKLLTRHDENNGIEVAFGGGAIVRITGEYLLV